MHKNALYFCWNIFFQYTFIDKPSVCFAIFRTSSNYFTFELLVSISFKLNNNDNDYILTDFIDIDMEPLNLTTRS